MRTKTFFPHKHFIFDGANIYKGARNRPKCLQPYLVEYTSSHPITEVKELQAQLVLGWVTAWEYWVL